MNWAKSPKYDPRRKHLISEELDRARKESRAAKENVLVHARSTAPLAIAGAMIAGGRRGVPVEQKQKARNPKIKTRASDVAQYDTEDEQMDQKRIGKLYRSAISDQFVISKLLKQCD
jgi:hypothetical protein